MDKIINVGLIGCDTHGIYFGALMHDHDPLTLRKFHNTSFFYFYTRHNDPTERTVPKAERFRIKKIWDEDRMLAERMSAVFNGDPEICSSYDEVSDDVDLVFIADCNGDGSNHLKLALPGLQKGVMTFVDKPFASRLDDAMKIIDAAKRNRTLVMSLSILREVPQLTLFKNRFPEIGEPEFAVIKGGGTTLAGQIHAISMAQNLFGYGVESVECMGQNTLGYIHLNYGEVKGKPWKGVVLNTDSGNTFHCALYASVYSKLGAIHSRGIGDYEFPFGAVSILEKTRKMVETRKQQVSYEEMLENIAVIDAARLAQETGKTVFLKEIYRNAGGNVNGHF